MQIPAIINITPDLLKREFTNDQIMDLIIGLDYSIHEVDFTEKLIIELVKSIKDDLSESEWLPYQNLLNYINSGEEIPF